MLFRIERIIMGSRAFTNTHDLMTALAASMNAISPIVEDHHEQAAYLSYHIAREMGLAPADRELVVLAALLHDVGAIFAEKPEDSLDFETNAEGLARISAYMLEGVEPLANVGRIVRHSQQPWYPNDRTDAHMTESLWVYASIVHLADSVSICLSDQVTALDQVESVTRIVKGGSDGEFCPAAVDAFLRVADKPYVWMDLVYHPVDLVNYIGEPRPLSLDDTIRLTRFMSRLIDFRSAFTAMHSAGVRASAVCIAELMGMSEEECQMMSIAGDLHDIGKIRVPRSILEKPGKLTTGEFNIIQEHAYYTYQILHPIEGFDQVCQWAAFHHEKLNGRGYPFRLGGRQLPLGSRIMAVADIFSAVAEERPYRAGMKRDAVERIMRDNVASGATCSTVTTTLLQHYGEVDQARDEASHDAGDRYFAALEESRHPF